MREDGLERHDVSMYVEEKVDYIHSRIALKPLINGLEHATKLITAFTMKVNTSLGKILANRIRLTLTKLDRKIHEMIDKRAFRSSTFDTIRERNKRAIEILGNLISKLFGNPGPEEWRQNTRNMLAMKNAIEKQMDNSVILHSNIDQNRHAINEQNEILKHVSREAIKNSNRLDLVDNSLYEFETYLDLESMFESILNILETLDDIRNDSKFGRCNEKGLSKEFLIEHLRSIESNKLGIAPIFASWEWQKYYESGICSLAIHEDELWVTMRIPIVNLAEQFVRTLPGSSQIWLRDILFDLGIDSYIFKHKNHDTFMLITRMNFESCLKLGMMRVCNIRKTKFRIASPFIAPVELSQSRIILLANTTNNNSSMKCVCNGETSSKIMKENAIVRVPDACSVIGRSFEISKDHIEENLSDTVQLPMVDKVTIRKLEKKDREEIKMSSNLKQMNTDFEKNNNETTSQLEKIELSRFSVNESMLLGMSSTSILLVLLVVLILTFLKCAKHCRNENEDHELKYVVVDKKIVNTNEDRVHDESAVSKDQTFSDIDSEQKNVDENRVLMDHDSKKPPFQQKR